VWAKGIAAHYTVVHSPVNWTLSVVCRYTTRINLTGWQLTGLQSVIPNLKLHCNGVLWPAPSTELFWLLTEAHACEQLAEGRHVRVELSDMEAKSLLSQIQNSNHHITTTMPKKSQNTLTKQSPWMCDMYNTSIQPQTFLYIKQSKSQKDLFFKFWRINGNVVTTTWLFKSETDNKKQAKIKQNMLTE